jgi:hypothetical protein
MLYTEWLYHHRFVLEFIYSLGNKTNKIRMKVDCVPRHVMGPFENWRSNVDQECCIRGPVSKDHYFCW